MLLADKVKLNALHIGISGKTVYSYNFVLSVINSIYSAEMEMMMKKLEEAAIEGNVATLKSLLQTDRLILDRQITCCYTTETPLHISSMLGHVDFTNEILSRKPEMASATSSPTKSTPLHLASAKGCLEIVKSLLTVRPETCFSVDKNGMNPCHVAAVKGNVCVLKELVKVRPLAVKAFVEKGGEKESILHLCVKYNQFEVLKFLVEIIGDDHDFVRFKDGDGNTILHAAVADKQIEMVKFIVSNTRVDVNAKNRFGHAAIDILAQSRRDVNDMHIYESLQLVGALRTRHLDSATDPPHHPLRHESHQNGQHIIDYQDQVTKKWEKFFKKQNNWLEKKRNSLMVVASLIATMAFQAGVNPPGGIWQDDIQTGNGANGNRLHKAGVSVMADNYSKEYKYYLICNTASFATSLSIILLLVSGLPIRHSFFMWLLMITMWISITGAGGTYAIAIWVLTSSQESEHLKFIIGATILSWLGLLGLLFVAHVIRILVLIICQIFRCIRRCCCCCYRRSTPNRRIHGIV